tara:strand:+ start:72 stop:776 length:705 start_codon:yes stop_codon:yes gene_type:complete
MNEMELEAPIQHGKLLSTDTSKMFVKGEVYVISGKEEKECLNLPDEITVENPNGPKDAVVIKVSREDAEKNRNMSAGTITKCYKLKKGEESEAEVSAKVLDECGEMPMPQGPATMPIAALSKKIGMNRGDVRRVVPHDREGHMAKSQLYKIAKYAVELMENLHDDDELESWVQSKITKAAAHMSAAKHYLEYESVNPPMVDEYVPMMESSKKKVDDIIKEVNRLKKKLKLSAKA